MNSYSTILYLITTHIQCIVLFHIFIPDHHTHPMYCPIPHFFLNLIPHTSQVFLSCISIPNHVLSYSAFLYLITTHIQCIVLFRIFILDHHTHPMYCLIPHFYTHIQCIVLFHFFFFFFKPNTTHITGIALFCIFIPHHHTHCRYCLIPHFYTPSCIVLLLISAHTHAPHTHKPHASEVKVEPVVNSPGSPTRDLKKLQQQLYRPDCTCDWV